MTDVTIDWYEETVQLLIDQIPQEALDAISAECEALTKVNITNNGQVDTGFMRSSAWSSGGSGGVGGAGQSAAAKGAAAGTGSAASGGGASAAAGVAAEYAIYQEMRNSFLYRAVEQLAGGKAGAIIQAVAR